MRNDTLRKLQILERRILHIAKAGNLRRCELRQGRGVLEMKNINFSQLSKAIETIKSGSANRVDINNIKIYKCGTIIRIDMPFDCNFIPERVDIIANILKDVKKANVDCYNKYGEGISDFEITDIARQYGLNKEDIKID